MQGILDLFRQNGRELLVQHRYHAAFSSNNFSSQQFDCWIYTVAVAGTSADAGSGVKQVAVRIRAGTTATAYTVATPIAPNDWSTWSVSMNLSSAGPTGPYILEARARTTQTMCNGQMIS